MKALNSPIATSTGHSLRLTEHGIPTNTADMYWEAHWAQCGNLKVMDCRFNRNKEEGVDHIPAWSLSRLIDLLPPDLTIGGEDEFEETQYDLTIENSQVSYKAYDGTSLMSISRPHLLDAIVDMIIWLCKDGWAEIILSSYRERYKG